MRYIRLAVTRQRAWKGHIVILNSVFGEFVVQEFMGKQARELADALVLVPVLVMQVKPQRFPAVHNSNPKQGSR